MRILGEAVDVRDGEYVGTPYFLLIFFFKPKTTLKNKIY